MHQKQGQVVLPGQVAMLMYGCSPLTEKYEDYRFDPTRPPYIIGIIQHTGGGLFGAQSYNTLPPTEVENIVHAMMKLLKQDPNSIYMCCTPSEACRPYGQLGTGNLEIPAAYALRGSEYGFSSDATIIIDSSVITECYSKQEMFIKPTETIAENILKQGRPVSVCFNSEERFQELFNRQKSNSYETFKEMVIGLNFNPTLSSNEKTRWCVAIIKI